MNRPKSYFANRNTISVSKSLDPDQTRHFVWPDLDTNCLQRLSNENTYISIEKDCRESKLTTVDPQKRSTWRSGVRSAMHAASQLPGRGPTDVDDAPAPAC